MMKKRTQNTIPGELAPIEVPPDFPVAEAVFNTRGETPVTHAHIHNLFEIGYCYSGSGVFLIGSKIFTFKPGDAVIITSREVHLATGNPGGVTSWGFLNFDPAGLVARHMDSAEPCFALDHCCGEDFTNIVDGEKYPELCECIRRIVEEGFDYLDAPPVLVSSKDVPLPFSSVLEDYVVVSVKDIEEALQKTAL